MFTLAESPLPIIFASSFATDGFSATDKIDIIITSQFRKNEVRFKEVEYI